MQKFKLVFMLVGSNHVFTERPESELNATLRYNELKGDAEVKAARLTASVNNNPHVLVKEYGGQHLNGSH